MSECILVGAPMDCGKRRQGCLMGADALRTAGLAVSLSGLGHTVRDIGNVVPDAASPPPVDNPNLHAHAEVVGWTSALMRTAREVSGRGMPIFMGGDHALSAGTVAGVAAHAADLAQPHAAAAQAIVRASSSQHRHKSSAATLIQTGG